MSDPGGRQHAFYATREHAHLRPGEGDHYADKLAGAVARATCIRPGDRVLELGAGFGRFTFALLEHCRSVVAVDFSERALSELEQTRARRGIDADRCQTLHADANQLSAEDVDGCVDAIVGFFFLHHVPDFATAIGRWPALLRPGARVAFVEPNRRNPLFALQLLACRDMPLREELGMFRLSYRDVEAAYRRADLVDIDTHRFGFFPPQVLNRSSSARSLEARLESWPWLRGALPFLLLSARAPESPR